MKIHLLTVPLLCILLASSTCTLAPECKNLNPFIKTFNPDLVLPASIKVVSARCRSLWVQGTCCKEELLAKAVESYNYRSEELIENYEAHLAEFYKKMTRFNKRYLDAFKTSLNNNIFDLDKQTMVLSQGLSSSFVQNQKVNIENCWNYVKIARSASLCSTCAADSPKFFKGNRALITQSDCKSMISDCQNYFYFVIEMVQSIRYIGQSLSHLNGGEFNDMSHGIKDIMPEVAGNRLINLIHAASGDDEAATKAVCESLYNLNAPSFMEQINPFFERYAQKIDDILKGVIQYCNGRLECKIHSARSLTLGLESSSNWGSSSDPAQVFASDVVVVPNADNMFSSHIGTIGWDSHLDESAQPMNLTILDFL